jgi:hypothetical protein
MNLAKSLTGITGFAHVTSEFWSKTFCSAEVFWVMFTGVATVILIIVAWKQLGDLGRISKADFIYRLKNDFFTDETRRLIFLVEATLIKFVAEPVAHFVIEVPDQAAYGPRLQELGVAEKSVSTYIIDDKLLGPLEDAGLLLDDGVITPRQAYEVFYTYTRSCAENSEIQKYIKWVRREPSDFDIYDQFLAFHEKLEKYSGKLLKKKAKPKAEPKAETHLKS